MSGAPQDSLKRLQADNLEGEADPAVGELFKGPSSWVGLRKMLVSGAWLMRRQQAGVVQRDLQMGLEDISTHIHETGMYIAHSIVKHGALIFFFMQNGVLRSHLSLLQCQIRTIALIFVTKSNSSMNNGHVM